MAGKSVTVSQASGCSYTVSPASLSFSKAGGTATVNVTTTSACGWASMLRRFLGNRHRGAARVRPSDRDSPEQHGGSRSVTLTVAARQVVVSQAGQ